MTKEESEQVAKMQKLRRAVERVRNLRSARPQASSKASWVERLRKRLGLPPKSADPE